MPNSRRCALALALSAFRVLKNCRQQKVSVPKGGRRPSHLLRRQLWRTHYATCYIVGQTTGPFISISYLRSTRLYSFLAGTESKKVRNSLGDMLLSLGKSEWRRPQAGGATFSNDKSDVTNYDGWICGSNDGANRSMRCPEISTYLSWLAGTESKKVRKSVGRPKAE